MPQSENHQDELATVVDIIKQHPVCMLTSHGQDGLLSHPMTVLKVEDDGELWMFSSIGSTPAEDIAQNPAVNLSFTTKDQWLSVRGSGAVITSEPKARELWNTAAAAFFPEGPESQDLILIRIRPDAAQFWESPGGAISLVFNWAKARITGQTIDAGESHTVEL